MKPKVTLCPAPTVLFQEGGVTVWRGDADPVARLAFQRLVMLAG
jgi:hypothetical protein